jgi:putative glutamine amidotransferase
MVYAVKRPTIGICTALEQASWGVWDQPAALLALSYIRAVQRAGALVLMLAPDERLIEEPDEALGLVDGLMLAGGADIDPSSYGQPAHANTVETVPERDAFELVLTRAAIARDMPLLGICRGMQLLNVACGGTLHQHLPDLYGHGEHRRVLGSFEGSEHDVRLREGSLAADAAGEIVHSSCSHHHQGVDRLGDGLVVSGVSALDDLVEAIEMPARRFVLGVQWHPEADEASTVVAALVAAAARSSLAGARE